MALCRMVAFASSTTRLKRRRTCFAGCRRTRGNALAKFQFALVGPGWASRFTPRSRLCKSTTSCATKSLQQSLKALLHLGANEFHSILAHTAKQKGPQLSPEASCFCAEGAFAWTASPSTCRPCRRRGAAGAADLGSGSSTTSASVVSSRAAIEAAFCSAVRVTLVGIDDAGLHQVLELAGQCVVAVVRFL